MQKMKDLPAVQDADMAGRLLNMGKVILITICHMYKVDHIKKNLGFGYGCIPVFLSTCVACY